MKPYCKNDRYDLLPTYKTAIIDALPDSGANKTILSKSFVESKGIKYSTTTKYRIGQADDSSLACSGVVSLNFFFEGRVTPIHALVASGVKEDVLICAHDLLSMRILPSSFPHVYNAATRSSTLEDLMAEYADVFDEDSLTPMVCEPMKIHLRRNDSGYKPLRVSIARKTPLHYKKEADKLIADLLSKGVIEKVPVNENVEWCSPGFFVPKPNGKVRLVTDFRQLNKFIDRPVHPFPSCRDIIHNIHSSSRWFLKFDAVHGYFQVPLDASSSRLTTFLVESGRYRFKRAPMGLNPSSDHFCERSDRTLQPVEGILKIVDDGLLQSSTERDLLEKFRLVLECCRRGGLTLSRKKVEMGQSVTFAGHIISKDGVQPEPKRTDAIRKFPRPTNVSEMRSFLGLVNQLGIFIPDLAHVTQPLRELLKKNAAFNWLIEHELAFQKTKELLLSDLLIKPFDENLKTQLLTDASRLKGLGYALVQQNDEKTELSLIQCGSRSLNSAESRYSTTELECLAIYYGVRDCSFYLQGIDFEVVTDHKPLVGTFQKSLGDIENARLLRLREKLAHFSFYVTHVAGKNHLIADGLSRAPVFDPPEEEIVNNHIFIGKVAADPSLQSLYDHALRDKSYKSVVKAILEGTDVNNLPPGHGALSLRSIWDDLSVYDDTLIVYDNSRIVVPKSARPEILEKLHLSHSGISKTRQLAKNLFYWPGMSNAIKQMVDSCDQCQRLRPSLHDNVQPYPEAAEPMHSVSVDLFSWGGNDYVVMIDRYSLFLWVSKLSSTTTQTVVNTLDRWFLEVGYPYSLVSDNGPQFRTDFDDFCVSRNIKHSTSSPYNPRSNGLAETGVKQAKYLLQKSANYSDFQKRLMEWRNVPTTNSLLSPAEKFYSRRQRTQLPAFPTPTPMAPPPNDTSLLPKLKIGDRVRLQHPIQGHWDQKGIVRAIGDTGLSYDVELDDGTLVRGRRLVKLDLSPAEDTASTPSAPNDVTAEDDDQPPAPRRSRRRRRFPQRYQPT